MSFSQKTFAGLPTKFEAGKGSLADAVGLGAALNYLNTLKPKAAG